jgi:hypothetical protein
MASSIRELIMNFALSFCGIAIGEERLPSNGVSKRCKDSWIKSVRTKVKG